jgi:hypothetical protein
MRVTKAYISGYYLLTIATMDSFSTRILPYHGYYKSCCNTEGTKTLPAALPPNRHLPSPPDPATVLKKAPEHLPPLMAAEGLQWHLYDAFFFSDTCTGGCDRAPTSALV